MTTALSDSNDALDRDAEAIRDAVHACRKTMIDLPLAHKTVVLNELDRWLVAEEATHDPAGGKAAPALTRYNPSFMIGAGTARRSGEALLGLG
jgi:hypothetical protein